MLEQVSDPIPSKSDPKTTARTAILTSESDASAKGRGKIPKTEKHRFLNAKEWHEIGVEVKQLSGELMIEDRETALAFIGREQYAEITTAHIQWQRRLESLGCQPISITTFERGAAQIRYYSRVPWRFIRMPSAGRKKITRFAPFGE